MVSLAIANEPRTLSGQAQGSHWAFVAPRRPELSEVRQTQWCRNEIDRFVLARLEREAPGLELAPEADRRTWLRRVAYDLIGLPPTFEEVRAFEQDQAPDAYERVVDRLLASPHYGERQARRRFGPRAMRT